MTQIAEEETDQAAGAGPKTYSIRPTAAPVALVIHCGDPRFQEPIRRFLVEELHLQPSDFVPLVIGGGAASFTLLHLPKEAKYVREAVSFYLGHFGSIRKIVVINHEDCGKYKALARTMEFFAADIRGRQEHDLLKMEEALKAFLPHPVEFDLYFAKFANSERTQVVFEKQ